MTEARERGDAQVLGRGDKPPQDNFRRHRTPDEGEMTATIPHVNFSMALDQSLPSGVNRAMMTTRTVKTVARSNVRRQPRLESCEARLLMTAAPATHHLAAIAPSVFVGTVTKGPDAGLSLDGTLYFNPTSPAHLSGELVEAGGKSIPFVGGLHGSALGLKFNLGHGETVHGSGTVTGVGNGLGDKMLVGGGKLTGPKKSDTGDWTMTSTTSYVYQIDNHSTKVIAFTTTLSNGSAINQSLAIGDHLDIYIPTVSSGAIPTDQVLSSSLVVQFTPAILSGGSVSLNSGTSPVQAGSATTQLTLFYFGGQTVDDFTQTNSNTLSPNKNESNTVLDPVTSTTTQVTGPPKSGSISLTGSGGPTNNVTVTTTNVLVSEDFTDVNEPKNFVGMPRYIALIPLSPYQVTDTNNGFEYEEQNSSS